MLNYAQRIYSLRSSNKFYKYLPKEYADKACLFGDLRIGTLSYFRQEELNDDERQDRGEGSIIRYVDDDIIGTPTPHQAKIIPSGITFNNCHFIDCGRSMVFGEKIDNFFIYCVSTVKSQKLMNDFCGDNGVCLEISNISRLIYRIDHALKMEGISAKFIGRGHCIYTDREFSYRDRLPTEPIYFLKPKKYSHQSEFRLVWAPIRNPISPMNVYCSRPDKIFRMTKW